jgi:hypothetical protein
MTDKMEQIESKIKGTVDDTRRLVDIRYQVSQRPWAALGASILIGYALGSIGGDDTPAQPRPGEPYRYYAAPGEERPRPPHEPVSSYQDASFARQEDARRAAQPGFVDQLMDQFGDEIQLLKAAAISSLFGLIRDTVRENMPALNQEVERLRSNRPADDASTPAGASDTPRTSGSDASKYYNTADTPLRERSIGEISTQTDVGRSPNYDFIPPAPHAEPGGRP